MEINLKRLVIYANKKLSNRVIFDGHWEHFCVYEVEIVMVKGKIKMRENEGDRELYDKNGAENNIIREYKYHTLGTRK